MFCGWWLVLGIDVAALWFVCLLLLLFLCDVVAVVAVVAVVVADVC